MRCIFSDIFLLPCKATAPSRILLVSLEPSNEFGHLTSQIIILAGRESRELWGGCMTQLRSIASHSEHETACLRFSCIPSSLLSFTFQWDLCGILQKYARLGVHLWPPRFSFSGISQGCLLRSKNPLWPKNTKTTNFPSYCDKYPFNTGPEINVCRTW